MSTGTNNCPDRDSIIYGSLSGAKLMLTDIMTDGEKRVHDILSDPDWRAWLEQTYQKRDPVIYTTIAGKYPFWELPGCFGGNVNNFHFDIGDRVKVTLEKIDA